MIGDLYSAKAFKEYVIMKPGAHVPKVCIINFDCVSDFFYFYFPLDVETCQFESKTRLGCCIIHKNHELFIIHSVGVKVSSFGAAPIQFLTLNQWI